MIGRPLDGLKNYGRGELMLSESWVPSPHRPTPQARFFVKQAASAAHLYGRKRVGAEMFTSIGPHWEDVLWAAQKPTFDHEICDGLNLAFIHTSASLSAFWPARPPRSSSNLPNWQARLR